MACGICFLPEWDQDILESNIPGFAVLRLHTKVIYLQAEYINFIKFIFQRLLSLVHMTPLIPWNIQVLWVLILMDYNVLLCQQTSDIHACVRAVLNNKAIRMAPDKENMFH